MTIAITLKCNGQGCGSALEVGAETVAAARIEARSSGWTTRRMWDRGYVTLDGCPTHNLEQYGSGTRSKEYQPQDPRTIRPRKDCTRPTANGECPDNPLLDFMGHDSLGHKVAHCLMQEGYTSVELVMALSDDQILDTRNVGRIGFERVKYAREHHTEGS